MTTHRQRFALGAAAFLVLASAACGTSPVAVRKAAQSNADKYFELLKAGKPDQAYAATFSSRHRQQLDLETFLRYRKGMDSRVGEIVEYQVVDSKVDMERSRVVLTYALQTSTLHVPIQEIVHLSPEGAEWRIDAVEPNTKAAAPPPPNVEIEKPFGK